MLNNKTKMFMIEDKKDNAEDYLNHSGISKMIKNITHITNYDDFLEAILENFPHNVFWVDVNLGRGKEQAGLDIIKYIREHHKNALILVYTAYASNRKSCIDAGADHFFLKGGDYSKTMDDINKVIQDFLDSQSRKIEYIAEVAHVDEEWVKFEFEYEGREYTRFYPIAPVEAALESDLVVDAKVKITYLEKGSKIEILFEKIALAPDLDEEEDDDDDLYNSNIWSNKIS